MTIAKQTHSSYLEVLLHLGITQQLQRLQKRQMQQYTSKWYKIRPPNKTNTRNQFWN